MVSALRVARFLVGLFLAFQAVSVFPLLTWLGNFGAMPPGLVLVIVGKVLLAAVSVAVFMWLGSVLAKKTKAIAAEPKP